MHALSVCMNWAASTSTQIFSNSLKQREAQTDIQSHTLCAREFLKSRFRIKIREDTPDFGNLWTVSMPLERLFAFTHLYQQHIPDEFSLALTHPYALGIYIKLFSLRILQGNAYSTNHHFPSRIPTYTRHALYTLHALHALYTLHATYSQHATLSNSEYERKGYTWRQQAQQAYLFLPKLWPPLLQPCSILHWGKREHHKWEHLVPKQDIDAAPKRDILPCQTREHAIHTFQHGHQPVVIPGLSSSSQFIS